MAGFLWCCGAGLSGGGLGGCYCLLCDMLDVQLLGGSQLDVQLLGGIWTDFGVPRCGGYRCSHVLTPCV